MTGAAPEVDLAHEEPTGRTLVRHADQLAVVRLPGGSDLPEWVVASTLLSVTATQAETSIVCHASSVPARTTSQGPFAAYEVAGPLDLTLVGVLHDLLGPLVEAEISVFVISTFDTDWLLVPANRVAKADEAWTAAGHAVEVAAEEPETDRADRNRKPGNPRRQGKNGPAPSRGKGSAGTGKGRDRGGRKQGS